MIVSKVYSRGRVRGGQRGRVQGDSRAVCGGHS